jgi:hypothetical protein
LRQPVAALFHYCRCPSRNSLASNVVASTLAPAQLSISAETSQLALARKDQNSGARLPLAEGNPSRKIACDSQDALDHRVDLPHGGAMQGGAQGV